MPHVAVLLARSVITAMLVTCYVSKYQTEAKATASRITPKIPADIREWLYHSEGTLEDNLKLRFWDREALYRADGAINYNQLRPFLEKLNSGQPVTVVGFGDSIVATHSGCFHRDVDHLKQKIPVLSDTYLRGNCASKFKFHWASSFMSMINRTWPHRDHIYINNGIAGTTLAQFASGEPLT